MSTEVPRTIGLAGGVSFIVGTIVGAGIFVSVKSVALYSGSVGLALVSWAVCGSVSLLGAFCYAELGTVIRASGGDYSYLEAAYGPVVSFQYSWITNLLVKPGSQATLALTFADYIVSSFYVILGGVNILSVKLASRIQICVTITKLFAMGCIALGGAAMLYQGHTEILMTGFEGSENRPGVVMTAFYSCMWAFDGWSTANFLTEEMIDVQKNLPLAILIAVPSVIIIYLFINISYFTVLSLQEIIDSNTVALAWADKVIPSFSWVVPIVVALSCFGACNGSMFSAGRLIKVAAQNNHLPSILSMVHVTQFTPVPAIIMTVVIGISITFLVSTSDLLNAMGFVQWIFYSLNFLSVIIFRYKKPYSEYPRLFKVPLLIPLICFCFSVSLVLLPFFTSPQLGYFFTLAFILLGYSFYLPFVHFHFNFPFMDTLTLKLQLLLSLFIPDRKDN